MSRRLIGSGLVKGTHRSRSESESSWGNCHCLWTRTWVIYP
uniref:ORF40u n=1 Tax=Pinus koraiensis TaxID=88728 RepID=Q85WS9_PINKO|nr:ORF40u [Pinus koraiensis]AAO74140.2 ORF40u [Pinus koraiensis]